MARGMRRVGCRGMVGTLFAAAVVATPTTAHAESPAPAWDDAPDWGFEARVGPSYGVRRPFGMEPGGESELGGVASIGFVRRLRYRPHTVSHSEKGGEEVVDVFAGIFTLGLAWIPPSVWYGTEIGATAEFQYRAGFGSFRDRWIAALRPAFRVAPEGSRFRYPAILGALAPAVGVAVDVPRTRAEPAVDPGIDTSVYLGPQLFPFGVLVDRHVALEIEPAAPVVIRVSDGKAAISPALTASVLFR